VNKYAVLTNKQYNFDKIYADNIVKRVGFAMTANKYKDIFLSGGGESEKF
jgi:hypothetical protein